ncbi:MAG: glycosyltransferase [Holophagales bacterium]|jgi:glycosyltransferase involved in cell wall biosynthesis/Tfp pilus assembly protein PilF|nr:glycosyltransferase [Holophagales bacterium]
MLVSLAMIVKNEEATLAHCLESVKPIVDEMVIVDTGSTDRTIEIAKGFGASVHHFQWCDDYSAARNESLKHCNGEWVLIIDADEAIDPLDYEKIKNVCTSPFADAYNLTHRHYLPSASITNQGVSAVPNTSDYSEGKGLPFFADNPVCRLARAFNGLTFWGRIHEDIAPWLSEHGKTVKPLDAVIHHYGKMFIDRDDQKLNYYYMLAAQEAERFPDRLKTQYNLLQMALPAKKWDVALRSADECIKISPTADSFVLLGRSLALHELGRFEEAVSCFDLLLSQEPGHAMALSGKAMSLVALGNIGEGRQTLLKAIALNPNYVSGHLCLAQLEMKNGDMAAARKVLSDAINAMPGEPKLYDQLINIELYENRPQQAASLAARAMAMCPNTGQGRGSSREGWQSIIAQYNCQLAESELTKGNGDAAKQILLNALESAPMAPKLYDLLIKIEMDRGNLPQAARHALKGIQNCQTSSPLWYRLAAAYLSKAGERHKAKSILEIGVKAFPGDTDLIRLMGII